MSGSDASFDLRYQIDLWYNNSSHQVNPRLEVLENNFDSAFYPGNWSNLDPATNQVDYDMYNLVVRKSCRGCHAANQSVFLDFENESDFQALATNSVNDLCAGVMPHSLQTLREFWQSGQPNIMERYLRFFGRTADADHLHGCGPGNIATLDPGPITASLL